MSDVLDPYAQHPAVVGRWVGDRQRLLRHETEDYLRSVILDYEPRRTKYWNRDYTSIEAFEKSVAPNRRRWHEAMGIFEPDGTALDPVLEPWCETDRFAAWWVTIGLLGSLRARGILALPKGRKGPAPLVIAHHGLGSSPESVFGLNDPSWLYMGYARTLVEEGFAVIAPMSVSGAHPRARIVRLCKLLGKTLWGLEIYRTKRLLDYLETRAEIDIGRTGMYGLSMGGSYSLFTPPLEPRIQATVVSAFFNNRRQKMAVDDPRYTCYLSVDEEHIWIPGWLREFTDSDLISLICPRPVLIEQGKADGIGWWPMMLEEYRDACEHYRKLGIEDRIDMDFHEYGHEIRMEKSLDFLKKWLKL